VHKDEAVPLTERKVVRRGLLAGLAGLGAAVMMKATGSRRVEAGHDNAAPYAAAGVVHLGVINDGGNAANNESATNVTATTTVVANGGTAAIRGRQLSAVSSSIGVEGSSGFFGVRGQSTGVTNGSSGVFGESSVIGVRGFATALFAQSVGVLGFLTDASTPIGLPSYNTPAGVLGIAKSGVGGAAVSGVATNDGLGNSVSNVGVHGQTDSGTGVRGDSTTGTGVQGKSSSSVGVRGESSTGVGVRGACQSGIGVLGVSDFQPGVEGSSFSSLGVRGLSTHSTAIVGISTNGHGLYGSTSSASSAGFVGENLAGGLAGYFAGNVQITGSLQVLGAKSAVIKMQDGTMGSVYCQESPEPYFEDFGRAQLVGGVANVQLEREFATLVKGGDYMVFCVPEGQSGGLYVSRRSATSFEVRDPANGNISFTYRIVTKRKDIEGKRFARVTDDVGKTLAASRAALHQGGTPPDRPSPPSPTTPPRSVPNAPAPIQTQPR